MTAEQSHIQIHTVDSQYQDGKQEIRVLLPDDYNPARAYRVLYVLPVEAGFQDQYGYALGLLQRIGAQNRHGLIMVQMGFEKEPWFGDHATDLKVRQASYVKDFIVPFIEKQYSTLRTPEGRLLLGFSKSGWGAFSLILTYPETFGYAAAWDAPFFLADFHFNMRSVYGTKAQLDAYRPDLLVPRQRTWFQDKTRLVLAGEKLWGRTMPVPGGGSHTQEMHRLLEREGIRHVFINDLAVHHRWDEAWMAPTLEALVRLAQDRDAANVDRKPGGEAGPVAYPEESVQERKAAKRFFSDDSFWNTPLPPNPEIDPRSGHCIQLLQTHVPNGGFWINTNYWTIPIYEVTKETPLGPVHQRVRQAGETYLPSTGFRHGPGFGPLIPLPNKRPVPARERDGHLALVDYERRLAWDMWGARWRADGQLESFTGMAYSLDGPGVFNPDHFPAWDGESIHCFGPSRHAGVPAIAGLIMHEEVRRGRIAHKLAFASCVNAFKEFVPPAIWGDGKLPGGIPEGAVLQLDPTLDLDRLRLSPAARTIARALQEYGMVNVDYGGGAAIYAEGLWGHSDRSWKGLLGERDLVGIPFEHFRLLKLPPITRKGFDIEAARRMTGEVWLACGQSNMEMTVQNSAEPAGSADPLLQLCQIPLRDSDSPCTDMQARWDVPAGGFSAVAYHFGRELRRTLNVPVTMISANLGATSIVSWMPREAVEADPHWAEIASRHTSSIAQYEWALKKRSEVADPKSVWLPPNPYVRRPSALYNGMIAPLRRLPIRGIIWYQGETDAAFPERYATLFPAMIRSWRQAFGRDLPIIFVQLSSFGGRPKEDWAPLREVQRVVAQTVPNTAMIVSLDVGDKDDIHPKRKQPVGERLARAARALVYGQPVAWRGPTLAGVDQDGRTLRFDNAGDGLRTDGQQLRGFEAAGADGEFHEVTAEIAGDTVIVTSPGEVRRIRYAWRSWTEANLFNSHGLPAEPFIKDVP